MHAPLHGICRSNSGTSICSFSSRQRQKRNLGRARTAIESPCIVFGAGVEQRKLPRLPPTSFTGREAFMGLGALLPTSEKLDTLMLRLAAQRHSTAYTHTSAMLGYD